jgi:hypothetical protein
MYYITYQYLTLDTKVKFASTGDRTGSPASQVGTLSKEVSRQLHPGHKRHRWALYLKRYLDNFTLDTNIKFASTGDRTRVSCVTGGHST